MPEIWESLLVSQRNKTFFRTAPATLGQLIGTRKHSFIKESLTSKGTTPNKETLMPHLSIRNSILCIDVGGNSCICDFYETI